LDKILGINAFSLERMADALDEYESEHDDGEHDHEHDENGLCMVT